MYKGKLNDTRYDDLGNLRKPYETTCSKGKTWGGPIPS